MATAFFILIVASIFFILRWFGRGVFSFLEALAAAPAMACLFWTVLTVIGAVALPSAAAALLGAGVLIAGGVYSADKIFRAKAREDHETAHPGSRNEIIFIIATGIALAALLLSLSLAAAWITRSSQVSMAFNTTVDPPYHLEQMYRFAFSNHYDFQEPNFSGEFLNYPFYINLVSGLLLKFRASLWLAYYIPLILLSLSSGLWLVLIARRWRLPRWLTLLIIAGSLLAGSLGYLALLHHQTLSSLPLRNGAVYPDQNISYPNLLVGLLPVQRAFALGLPLFLISLALLVKSLREPKNRNRILVWAGIIIGLMPFAHTHSFIAATLVALAVTIYAFFSEREYWYDLVRRLWFPLIVLALPAIAALLLLPRFSLGLATTFRLGWMSAPGQVGGIVLPYPGANRLVPWLRYIWLNFGLLLLLPLVLAAGWSVIKDRTYRVLALAAGVLWLVPNLVQFQVWDYDNNKMFSLAIILSFFAAGLGVVNLSGRRKIIAVAVLIIIIAASAPSTLLAGYRMFRNFGLGRTVMFTPPQQKAGEWLRHNTSEDAVILSSAAILDPHTVLNPVVTLAARKTTLGFITWLYTHNIDYQERLDHVNAFLANPVPGSKALADVPADYIVVDSLLRRVAPNLERGLMALHDPVVYRDDEFEVIKLR